MVTVISHDLLSQGDVHAILESTGSEYVHVNSKTKKISIINLGMTPQDFKNFNNANALNIFSKSFTAQTINKIGTDICVVSNGNISAEETLYMAEKIKPLIGKMPIIAVGTGQKILLAALSSTNTPTPQGDQWHIAEQNLYGVAAYDHLDATQLF